MQQLNSLVSCTEENKDEYIVQQYNQLINMSAKITHKTKKNKILNFMHKNCQIVSINLLQ